MTRVTPQQLSSISFPETSKYVPLRPLNERISSDEKGKSSGPQAIFGGQNEKKEQRAVAGSIVLLRDAKPDVEGQFIELNRALWPVDVPIGGEPEPAQAEPEAAAGVRGAAGGTGASGALSGGEADAPPAFEYPFDD